MTDLELNELSLAYWSGRAPEFSALRMAEYETQTRERLREFIRAHLPKKPGDEAVRALDIGCGAGFLTLLLLELGCETTAVDFSKEMLVQAEKNLKDHGFEGKAQLLCMDAQRLGFPEGQFDFVLSRNVLWIVPDAQAAYSEAFRVLKNGGVLLNMDANYGRTFNEADARGERPTHPTQTEEQLRTRNLIARDLEVTKADRPLWDLTLLWQAGASEVQAVRDLETRLGLAPGHGSGGLFAVVARK